MSTVQRRRPAWTLRRLRAFVRYHVVGIHTLSGRLIDVVVILAIVAGVLELALDSIPSVHAVWGDLFDTVEVVIGSLFLLEYLSRLWVERVKLRYAFSFWGIIDVLAIMPFVTWWIAPTLEFAFLRLFRVLRIFAILKIGKYTESSDVLLQSLMQSRAKIGVFLTTVFVLVLVQAFTIQLVEPETFPTVPDAVWWTVGTLTTVGYGDVVPATPLGKALASLLMLTAFGIIAVPTGIVASEVSEAQRRQRADRRCPRCSKDDCEADANYCSRCGERL